MRKFGDGTHGSADYIAYNTRIAEIAAADAYTSLVETADAEWQVDGNHWAYAGYKLACERLIDEWLRFSGGATSSPSISPPTGVYEDAQDVTISGTGTLKYTTDDTDPLVGGTTYSGSFSAAPPITVRATAIVVDKASATAEVEYGVGTIWFDKGDNIALSVGNSIATGGAAGWAAARGSTGHTTGKKYFELRVVLASSGSIAAIIMDDATARRARGLPVIQFTLAFNLLRP
jgi:hypothetical protein